jgi:bile acid:Na+ symporter, BASS family
MGDLFLRYEYFVAATQLIFAMLGIGATLRPQELVAVLRFPTGVATGLVLQLAAMPLLCLVLMRLLPLPEGIAIGMAILAAVPGGTMSNLLTYYARANVALSVALTAITTLACLVTTPLLVRALIGGPSTTELAMPIGRVSFEIACCLLGPLAIGMMLGGRLGARRQPFASTCVRISFAMILVMVIGSASAGRVDILAQGPASILGLAVFVGAAQLIGLLGAAAMGLSRADRVAIAMETTVRNTNLGLLLKASLFPARPGVPDPVADGVLFMVLLYGGFALVSAFPMARLHRRWA